MNAGGRGSRPDLLVVVAGTGTEVGKTWVACRLLRELRAGGRRVAARKPVQSFDPADTVTDADLLAEASGEEPLAVCPAHRRYEVAMAPPMASDVLGRPRIELSELVGEIEGSWPPPDPGVEVGLVEPAGGVRSPIAHDGDGVELIDALSPDLVVVVADAGLGTLNAVRTTLDSLGDRPWPVWVHLNRFDPGSELHRCNRAWLQDPATPRDDVAALTNRIPDLVRLVEARLRSAGT